MAWGQINGPTVWIKTPLSPYEIGHRLAMNVAQTTGYNIAETKKLLNTELSKLNGDELIYGSKGARSYLDSADFKQKQQEAQAQKPTRGRKIGF